MTKEYRNQSDVAKWCGVFPAAVSNWINRRSDWPQPDVIILGEDSTLPIRGWLPERKAEWLEFARQRRMSPTMTGKMTKAKAKMVIQAVQDGEMDPTEALEVLGELLKGKVNA